MRPRGDPPGVVDGFQLLLLLAAHIVDLTGRAGPWRSFRRECRWKLGDIEVRDGGWQSDRIYLGFFVGSCGSSWDELVWALCQHIVHDMFAAHWSNAGG